MSGYSVLVKSYGKYSAVESGLTYDTAARKAAYLNLNDFQLYSVGYDAGKLASYKAGYFAEGSLADRGYNAANYS